jgi:hypothetical protein
MRLALVRARGVGPGVPSLALERELPLALRLTPRPAGPRGRVGGDGSGACRSTAERPVSKRRVGVEPAAGCRDALGNGRRWSHRRTGDRGGMGFGVRRSPSRRRNISPGARALGRLVVSSAVLGTVGLIRREPLPHRRDLLAIAAYGVLWLGVYSITLNAAERRVASPAVPWPSAAASRSASRRPARERVPASASCRRHLAWRPGRLPCGERAPAAWHRSHT